MEQNRKQKSRGRWLWQAMGVSALLAVAVVQAMALTANPVVESRELRLQEVREQGASEAMEFALMNVFPELREARRSLNDFCLSFPGQPLTQTERIQQAAIKQAELHFQPVLDQLLEQDLTISEVRVQLAAHMIQHPALPQALLANLESTGIPGKPELTIFPFDDLI